MPSTMPEMQAENTRKTDLLIRETRQGNEFIGRLGVLHSRAAGRFDAGLNRKTYPSGGDGVRNERFCGSYTHYRPWRDVALRADRQQEMITLHSPSAASALPWILAN